MPVKRFQLLIEIYIVINEIWFTANLLGGPMTGVENKTLSAFMAITLFEKKQGSQYTIDLSNCNCIVAVAPRQEYKKNNVPPATRATGVMAINKSRTDNSLVHIPFN